MNVFDSDKPVWVDSKFTSKENSKLSGFAYSRVKTHNFKNSNSKEAFDTWITASMWGGCEYDDVSKQSSYFAKGIDFLTSHQGKKVAHEVKFESYTTGNQALEMFTFCAKEGVEGNWKTGWMYSSTAAWLHAIFPCGLALIVNMDELRSVYVEKDSEQDYCMAINNGPKDKFGLPYDDKGPLAILNKTLDERPFSHVSFSVLSVVEETLTNCKQAYLVDLRELFAGQVLNIAEHFDKPCFIDKKKWTHRVKTIKEMEAIFLNGPEFSVPVLPYEETGIEIEFEVYSKLSKSYQRINELKINPSFQALTIEKIYLEPNMGTVFHSMMNIENAKAYVKDKLPRMLSKDVLRCEWLDAQYSKEEFQRQCAERLAAYKNRRASAYSNTKLDMVTEVVKLKTSFNQWCEQYGVKPRYEGNSKLWENEEGRDLRGLVAHGIKLHLRDPSYGDEGKSTVHLT